MRNESTLKTLNNIHLLIISAAEESSFVSRHWIKCFVIQYIATKNIKKSCNNFISRNFLITIIMLKFLLSKKCISWPNLNTIKAVSFVFTILFPRIWVKNNQKFVESSSLYISLRYSVFFCGELLKGLPQHFLSIFECFSNPFFRLVAQFHCLIDSKNVVF